MTEGFPGARASHVLGLLRIAAALLFMQHGVQKLFGWPPSPDHPPAVALLSLSGAAGLLEAGGGLLVLVGLFTRPVAFVLSGQMAVAYWLFHFRGALGVPNGWMPVANGGDAAILFCFCFLYLWAAGPGSWSLDAQRGLRRSADPA